MADEKTLIDSLEDEANLKKTENGETAFRSTKSGLIDLFATIGAMRNRSDEDIINAFEKAYLEDKLLAMKMLFYARDVLQGLGERRVFRVIETFMAKRYPDVMKKNLKIISDFGRWDDLYDFVGTPIEADAFAIMKEQFDNDLSNMAEGKAISLLGKWLKSVNTSSNESRKLGRLTAKYFGLSEKEYRKSAAKLRAYTNVVEVKMTSNQWDSIDYESVPSKAANLYREAFERHDEDRYNDYVSKLVKGEAKINAAAIMPYDIVKEYYNKSKTLHWKGSGCEREFIYDEVIEQQWKALPNFVNGEHAFIVMADTSGSMSGLPMETSVSLAIYFAEKNKGAYHNKFMTFSTTPSLVSMKDGESLCSKVATVNNTDPGGSTNLEAAFSMILDAAVKGHVDSKELPSALVVITDMEIDSRSSGADLNFMDDMEARFKDAGYEMPVVVWWNVNARSNTFHGKFTDPRVRFISGSSAATFKGLCEHMGETPYELMVNTLNVPRYEVVRV